MAVVRANQMVLLARLGMVGERSAMARRRSSSSSWVREVLLIIATPMPGLVCLAPVRAVPHVPHLAEEQEQERLPRRVRLRLRPLRGSGKTADFGQK